MLKKDWTSVCRSLEYFCARRERSPAAVRRRMAELGLDEVAAQTLWEHLVRDRFVDEERYACAFANDKMRLERRGRLLIRCALHQQGVSPAAIERALTALDPQEYADAFRQALAQKRRYYAGHPNANLKVRAALLRAGFEPELFEHLNDLET
ncbi:MAG: regulatory protein RecX [Saprospiraceae bacterium]|nr:RecX family transcriptional regulator [Saprospiraceae bacterium]MDW8228672.1 regulatory protein RecX [Saprospiraceae bacterium]